MDAARGARSCVSVPRKYADSRPTTTTSPTPTAAVRGRRSREPVAENAVPRPADESSRRVIEIASFMLPFASATTETFPSEMRCFPRTVASAASTLTCASSFSPSADASETMALTPSSFPPPAALSASRPSTANVPFIVTLRAFLTIAASRDVEPTDAFAFFAP